MTVMPRFGASEFNTYQSTALQSYGSSQSAVDYILAQRYGAAPESEREGFGMAATTPAAATPPPFPSILELRYRGL